MGFGDFFKNPFKKAKGIETTGGGLLGSGVRPTVLDWGWEIGQPKAPRIGGFGDINRWPVSVTGGWGVGTAPSSPPARPNTPTVPTTMSPIPNSIPSVNPTPGAVTPPSTGLARLQPTGGRNVTQPIQTGFEYLGNGFYRDNNGGRTYSSSDAENKQYGYWGSEMYNNPFGDGLLIGGGVSSRVFLPEDDFSSLISKYLKKSGGFLVS